MKTQDYVTNEDYKFPGKDLWSEKVLPVGTFVKPIEPQYVPQHIKDEKANAWFDPIKETYVYCSFGILVIPRKIIREV